MIVANQLPGSVVDGSGGREPLGRVSMAGNVSEHRTAVHVLAAHNLRVVVAGQLRLGSKRRVHRELPVVHEEGLGSVALLEPSDGLALPPVQGVLQNPKEHVLLAVDVVAEPRLGHADCLGNIADERPSIALSHHELRCRAKDLLIPRLSFRRRHWSCCVCSYPHSEKYISARLPGVLSTSNCRLSFLRVRQVTDRSVETSRPQLSESLKRQDVKLYAKQLLISSDNSRREIW